MDKKDLKLISALLTNSRLPINSLAKKSGVSREVAIYRINNLNKEIIKGYYTTINYDALGYKRYGCIMQFSRITIEKEEALIEEIAKNNFVNMLGPIIGKWNVAFDILAKDEIHLREILNEIISLSGTYLDSFVITNPGGNYDYFPLKYIGQVDKNNTKNKITEVSYDEIDKKILNILSDNSRTDYAALSKLTKLSPNAVKYRIKNMEKTGLIQGYTISLDYTKLGYQMFNIQIKIISQEKKLISYLTQHPSVIYYYTYLGQQNWDIDIGMIVKNIEDLRKLIIDIKKEFGEFIKIYDIFMNPKMIKDNVAPVGIFE